MVCWWSVAFSADSRLPSGCRVRRVSVLLMLGRLAVRFYRTADCMRCKALTDITGLNALLLSNLFGGGVPRFLRTGCTPYDQLVQWH